MNIKKNSTNFLILFEFTKGVSRTMFVNKKYMNTYKDVYFYLFFY